MDEDQILQSIIADPQLTDPSIDVGQLRQTTPTRTELLADVPEFSGLKFDPTQRSYIEDLYTLYGGGAPMLPEPVVDTPVVDTTPTVDTSAMDQPAGDSVLDTTPTNTEFEQNLIDQGIGVQATPADPVVAPGEMPLTQDDFDAFNEIAVTPVTPVDTSIAIEDLTQPSNVGDFQVTAAPPLGNQTGTIDVAPDIFDINVVGDPALNPGSTMVQGEDPYGTPEQQEGFLQNVLGKAGQTVEGALNELGKVPGAVVDFANQTVDVFGQKLNVGKTLASAAINKLAGGPISLVFELLPQESLENTTTRSIVDELKAEKDYGFNIQSGNLNQDPFGRNPVSAFGDYEQTLKDDILGVNQTGFQTAEMREAKKEFAQDYFDKKAEKAGGVEVDEGTVLGPGEAPGDLGDFTTGDVNIVDEVALTGGDSGGRDTGPDPTDPADDFEVSGDVANVGTAMDLIGPTSTSQEIPDRNRGDGGGSGAISNEQAAANQDAARGGQYSGGGGSSGGGGKIVCTMMNESYGFGSFRNKIWLRHSKNLAPEYQIGYHKIFLPLVKLSKTNKILKKTLEHIAVHRTIDIRQESRGKVHLLGRVYRKILEPICYWVGKHG